MRQIIILYSLEEDEANRRKRENYKWLTKYLVTWTLNAVSHILNVYSMRENQRNDWKRRGREKRLDWKRENQNLLLSSSLVTSFSGTLCIWQPQEEKNKKRNTLWVLCLKLLKQMVEEEEGRGKKERKNIMMMSIVVGSCFFAPSSLPVIYGPDMTTTFKCREGNNNTQVT